MTASKVVVERGVPVTMRDGVRLSVDVYRPDSADPVPAILGRTHYGKHEWGRWIAPEQTASEGYAVVVGDMRGQFGNEGEFHPFRTDARDGHDTVEWCAAQPWCSGKIGMFGSSSGGFAQLLTALERPPHLTAIAPMQSWSSFGRGNIYYPGGAFSLYSLWWGLYQATINPSDRLDAGRDGYPQRLAQAADDLHHVGRWYRHATSPQCPPLPRELAPYYHDWVEHPDDGEFWRALDVTRQYERIEVPALHLVGWFDRFSVGTIGNYLGISRQGGSELARRSQRIVIGPWPHGVPVKVASGDRFYGRNGRVDARALLLRFYDHWLKGQDNGVMDSPPVQWYMLGEDEWRTSASWPPPGGRAVRWHLRSGGRANSSAGDGALTDSAPEPGEPADCYRYDPGDPVPAVAPGADRPAGPVDRTAVEAREDVLVYSSAPLEEAVEIAGPVRAVLWATTSACDTDFAVRLCDVRPDGYVMPLSDGMIRSRYRHSQERPEPLVPGRAERFEIELLPIANCFEPGHRIRVEVTSSCFPQFDANPNTGEASGPPGGGVPATQLVHHDRERPSHIELTVIGGGAGA